jgi:hypothetical protein
VRIFLGFAKSDRDNISAKEMRVLQGAAKVLLSLDDKGIEKAVKERRLIEVKNDD